MIYVQLVVHSLQSGAKVMYNQLKAYLRRTDGQGIAVKYQRRVSKGSLCKIICSDKKYNVTAVH
jgi:hypothetical protein